MTFEERMDAITMNMELMGHRLEDTRREAEERQREAEARQREWEARHHVVAIEIAHLREQGEVLLKATTQMLAVADAHDRRLARLEGLSA
ncbi:MAG: hypothetical protein EBY17_07890 [Acidobacteriia bacterium]|nr:hypothetical protein [Terriglobia bacterium]